MWCHLCIILLWEHVAKRKYFAVFEDTKVTSIATHCALLMLFTQEHIHMWMGHESYNK